MTSAITNTSPLFYSYRIDGLEWLRQLFDEIWMPNAVVTELRGVYAVALMCLNLPITLGSTVGF